MNDNVIVVPYDAEWPKLFAAEANRIKDALGDNCVAIHHIGSTSVPGLSAKPIIDILPVVKDIMQVDQANARMRDLGYEAKGELGMAFRRFFQKVSPEIAYHVHVYEEGNPETERHLKFRDWLRTHPQDRDAYAKLKIDLAAKFPNDQMNYILGKWDFIADIDSKTGFEGLRMVKALVPREWQAVRNFRQKNFFDRIPIADPYTWTFDHPDHVHFVLYRGSKIVGYAHLQLWADHRAALRIIVIDESYRNQGIGSEFLKLCECWLFQQNINRLLVQAAPEAHQFYMKNGYAEMPFNDPEGHETHPRDIEMGKILNG